MLSIISYGSGSSGNCYCVSDGKAVVMLDCGFPYGMIQELTGYMVPDAVFVTHEHKDHSMAVEKFLKVGIPVYMTQGTLDALSLAPEIAGLVHVLSCKSIANINGICVTPFATQHDAAEPCGFLLDDGEDRLLYATDTYFLKYRFRRITKMMLEANHSYDIVQARVQKGEISKGFANRLMKSHFALENLLTFLSANDLSSLKEIWLVHLSAENADPARFWHDIMARTGVPVYVAAKQGGVLSRI